MTKKPYELSYYGTRISIKDTVIKIKKLLTKYNLTGTQITETGKFFRLVFALEKDGKSYAFQFDIVIPTDPKFARQKFRAFYWHLKSRLEVVDFGLFTLQEIFMPELLIRLPDGRSSTIKKALQKDNLLELDYKIFEG